MTDPFASFVTDPANAAAVSAARSAADLGRALHAPLVIVGPRGSGKSHLLRVIRDRAVAAKPVRQVELISVSRLAELLHTRGLGDGAGPLRSRLVGVDLLLIDEFETVVRQLPLQALLHDVLESRLAAGREVVVASGLPLDRLAGLDARLRRRLESGTVVGLELPGPAARRTILERRVVEGGLTLDPGVVAAVAARDFRSVKEYLGALGRIAAFQEAAGAPIPPDDAMAIIGAELSSANGHAPEPVRTAAADIGPGPTGSPVAEEFDAFLSEVAASVARQFDHWRVRLREAIAHWQGRGVSTRRLEKALTDDPPGDPEPLIAEFGRDAAEIERLAAEARVLAPDLAGAGVLRDPDQLSAARELLEDARSRRAPLSAPLAGLTLGTLGAGPSNRQALEAARSVIEAPGARHNPLVLVGQSGVGKTHLLHAIGNTLQSAGLSPVACLSAHSFLGEVGGLRSAEEAAAWRARYQWVAALALDDLHILANETRAQEELLAIFSALASGGRQLIFSSARRLSDLEGFDPRLLTRLEAGLVVDLLPPDREVRLAVVKGLLGGDAPADAVLADYLAGRPADSVRAVQGAVQRVLSEARAQGVEATPALAREILDAVGARAGHPIRRGPAGRASGLLSPGLGIARSAEKMVTRWPTPADRLMLELR